MVVRTAHTPSGDNLGSRRPLEEFTELRWITVQDTERHSPI